MTFRFCPVTIIPIGVFDYLLFEGFIVYRESSYHGFCAPEPLLKNFSVNQLHFIIMSFFSSQDRDYYILRLLSCLRIFFCCLYQICRTSCLRVIFVVHIFFFTELCKVAFSSDTECCYGKGEGSLNFLPRRGFRQCLGVERSASNVCGIQSSDSLFVFISGRYCVIYLGIYLLFHPRFSPSETPVILLVPLSCYSHEPCNDISVDD